MRENKLKAIWARDEAAVNGWLHIPSSWSAEVMAHAGWDSITVDMQHGFHNMESVLQMLQAISTTDTVPMVRVNWNEPGIIMRVLDAGAYGIICPMINTREECEAFVQACRYPPQGIRSLGPTRARVYAGMDYAEHANDTVVTMAMVETQTAMDNLEAIASVPGLDGIFVGTGDLRLTMTGGIGFGQDDTVDAALDTILEMCKKHNLIAGVFTAAPEKAREMIEKGYQFVTVKTDSMLLGEYAAQMIQQTRPQS
ncbi:MAG: HpcH/HpaI aldolase family protein [Aggregatilineales bacterium]